MDKLLSQDLVHDEGSMQGIEETLGYYDIFRAQACRPASSSCSVASSYSLGD